jgi:TPR repeat protein
MDSPRKFINLNILIINLIKCLTVAAFFISAAPVFADTNQESACYSKYNAGDYDTAFHICTKAAEQGEVSAQFNLGLMNANGIGTPKDDKQALYWFTKAAEQGFVDAQLNLGVMYANGSGTPKDDKQALYWYTKAAEQGDAEAQLNLGLIYRNGEGTPKDDKQAFYWFTKAAEQGDYKAQFFMGFMYDMGKGTLKDSILAYAWYNVSASQGLEPAFKNRDSLEEAMTPNQIAEAQKLSKEFYGKYVK